MLTAGRLAAAASIALLALAGCGQDDRSRPGPAPTAPGASPRWVPEGAQEPLSDVRIEVTGRSTAYIGWGVFDEGAPVDLGEQRETLPYRHTEVVYLGRGPMRVEVKARAADPNTVLTCRLWVNDKPGDKHSGTGSVGCAAEPWARSGS